MRILVLAIASKRFLIILIRKNVHSVTQNTFETFERRHLSFLTSPHFTNGKQNKS